MTYDFLPSVAAPLARLIQEFHKLPGIGPKSAQRLAYYLIRMPAEEANSLAESIVSVKEKVVFCNICQNITEESPCYLCSHPSRDRSRICVVEEPLDVAVAGAYAGIPGPVPRAPTAQSRRPRASARRTCGSASCWSDSGAARSRR